MLLYYNRKEKQFFCEDPSSIGVLRKSRYGVMRHGRLYLSKEEVLYLMEMRNAVLQDEKLNTIGIEDFFRMFVSKEEGFVRRYFTFRDWRERGLFITPHQTESESCGMPVVNYPVSEEVKFDISLKGHFLKNDLTSIVVDERSKDLYEKGWFGQYGTYKQYLRGKMLKLDAYEALYLMEKGILDLDNYDPKKLRKEIEKKLESFSSLYDVYADWRKLGYVVKSGFKFGTHFRIYFPGALPVSKSEVHSRHVIHVFPRDCEFAISDWSRAVRVAHSVRKTFILAFPGSIAKQRQEEDRGIDFYVETRHEEKNDRPKAHLLCCLHEDNVVKGADLSWLIEMARQNDRDLLLSVVDRETSVTYYQIKRIVLPGSKYSYYELEWVQP